MWSPEPIDDAETVSGRLLNALRRDIAEGRLAPGAKLPPHRELAHKLKIGVGTVTTVYAEAARQGLVTAQVGRGSFVADAPAARDRSGPILLGQNVPPLIFAQRRFAAALAKLRTRADLLDQLDYAPPAGHDLDRRLGARWIERTSAIGRADPARLVVTTGAQQAMTLAFDTLCRRGDTILTEAASYFGVKSIAETGGYRVRGVAMDGEGLLPEALDRAADDGARVLYTLPTLQNPTGRIMGDRRRADIAEVARRRGLWIVEDDLYSAFALGTAPPPLAAYAPERVFYINGTSKALAPGLRTGYLIVPDAERLDHVLRLIRARIYAPASMGARIASQWIEDGSADEIVAEVLAEMAARNALAMAQIGHAVEPPQDPRCPHLWMPMAELDAERFAARAMRAGVELTVPSAPLVDAGLISGVRICLGTPADRATLAQAIDRIAAVFDERSAHVAAVV
jgi:DNA-binding transcriptional MocR family regulator